MMSRSAEETRTAGRELARRLKPGDRVLLEGPLGSGKTTFVQGIAEGLGATRPATSPSFVIVHEYPLGAGIRRRPAGSAAESQSPAFAGSPVREHGEEGEGRVLRRACPAKPEGRSRMSPGDQVPPLDLELGVERRALARGAPRSPGPGARGPTILRHIDLYRLPDPAVDLEHVGFPELLNDPAAVTVVEWADRMPADLPAVASAEAGALRGGGAARRRILRIRFIHGQREHERTIDIWRSHHETAPPGLGRSF